jgi:hypothetical protein
LIQLSNHLQWLSNAPTLKTQVIHWKTKDGIELSGSVRFPPNCDPSRGGRLPAILFIPRYIPLLFPPLTLHPHQPFPPNRLHAILLQLARTLRIHRIPHHLSQLPR